MKIIGVLLGLLVSVSSYAADVSTGTQPADAQSACVQTCLQKVKEFCQAHTDKCPHKGGAPLFCDKQCKKQDSLS